MHHLATSFFPRRKPAHLVEGTPCPALPIAFTRDVAIGDWIEVQLGKGPCDERQSVAAQVAFLGRSTEDQIGFVARSADGTAYRGWEDPALLASGPAWVAAIISTGSLVLPISMHGAVFSQPIKPRPIRRHTRATGALLTGQKA